MTGLHCDLNQEDRDDMIRKVNKLISTTRTGTVTLEDFRRVVKRVPDLIKPLLDAQRAIQNQCLNYHHFWKGHMEQRYQPTCQPPTLAIYLSHVNK